MMFYELPPTETDQYNSVPSDDKPKTIGCATAVYDFEGRYEDELSVNIGDYLLIIQAYDEWVMAKNPITSMSGLIPAAYLQILFDNACSTSSHGPISVNGSSSFNDANSFNDASAFNYPTEYDEAPIESLYSRSMNDLDLDQMQRDSGNNSLSSSNTENDLKSTQDNLDDFMELFGLKSNQSIQETPNQVNQAKPPRPPPPQMNKPIRSAPLRPTISRDGAPEWHMKFAKIVEELISSEITYSSELQNWEKVISQSKKLTEQQKCVLTNGYPMLQDLSQILIRSLADQFDKKPEHQAYGQMFMGLRDKITRTYSYYFRCILEITQIMENREDKVTQNALQECLKQMRDSGVFIFDITTAIVRPINRCLKYPLFIAELLKLLPLTHIDHPKLLEAKNQMKTLVQKMNESKRRKELVKKAQITSQQDASIVNKLSKLNMHSIRKKSKRIVSSIVLSGNPKQIQN